MKSTYSIKYTPNFNGGTFISNTVVQCLSLSLNKATTQVLGIVDEYKLLKGFNLFRLATAKLNIGNVVRNVRKSMREKWKCKQKFGGAKVCNAEQVRKYFVKTKIKNEVFG